MILWSRTLILTVKQIRTQISARLCYSKSLIDLVFKIIEIYISSNLFNIFLKLFMYLLVNLMGLVGDEHNLGYLISQAVYHLQTIQLLRWGPNPNQLIPVFCTNSFDTIIT